MWRCIPSVLSTYEKRLPDQTSTSKNRSESAIYLKQIAFCDMDQKPCNTRSWCDCLLSCKPTIKAILLTSCLPSLQRRSLYCLKTPTTRRMAVWELKKSSPYVWCLPLVPQLADGIRAKDSKSNRYARCRGLRFTKPLSTLPWPKFKTSAKRSHVVRLRATSLGLYKVASWRLGCYLFTNICFRVLPKIRAKVLMRTRKIPELQRYAESVSSSV